MENPEEILQSLEEFSKLKPKDIPRELEDYLCFVAKTGDPVYQWSAVKSLFREKLLNVITDFYESCPSIDIPPCPNVDVFNYETMKNFILEKLDTFAAAPFTVQRICELLTTPRKEYNRIDKYMRALEKNILVVSTTEPGNRRNTENGDGFVNGIENEHSLELNSNSDINVEEMDDTSWAHVNESDPSSSDNSENKLVVDPQISPTSENVQDAFAVASDPITEKPCNPKIEPESNKITEDSLFVSIEPVVSNTCSKQADAEPDVTVTITAIPAAVQKRRDSIEPVVSSEIASEQVSSTNDISTVQTENLIHIQTDKIAGEPHEAEKSGECSSVPAESSHVSNDSNEDIKMQDDQLHEIKSSDESTVTDDSLEKNEECGEEEKNEAVADVQKKNPIIEKVVEVIPDSKIIPDSGTIADRAVADSGTSAEKAAITDSEDITASEAIANKEAISDNEAIADGEPMADDEVKVDKPKADSDSIPDSGAIPVIRESEPCAETESNEAAPELKDVLMGIRQAFGETKEAFNPILKVAEMFAVRAFLEKKKALHQEGSGDQPEQMDTSPDLVDSTFGQVESVIKEPISSTTVEDPEKEVQSTTGTMDESIEITLEKEDELLTSEDLLAQEASTAQDNIGDEKKADILITSGILNTPDTLNTPNTINMAGTPNTSDKLNISDPVNTMDVISTSDVLNSPNVPSTPDILNAPNVLNTPCVVTASNIPSTSGLPSTSDVLSNIDVLSTPDVINSSNTSDVLSTLDEVAHCDEAQAEAAEKPTPMEVDTEDQATISTSTQDSESV